MGRPWNTRLIGIASLLTVPVFALGMLYIDYSMFSIYAGKTGKTANMDMYMAMRLAEWMEPEPPKPDLSAGPAELPAKRYETLTLKEKKQYARNWPAALGPAPEGWTLRPFEGEDFWLLLPNLAGCEGKNERPSMLDYLKGSDCPMRPSKAGRGTWVYAKEGGTQRVAVHIRFERHGGHKPKYNFTAGGINEFIGTAFNGQIYNEDHPLYFTRGSVRYGKVPGRGPNGRLERGEPFTTLGEDFGPDGTLRVLAVSNAGKAMAKRLLMSLDYGYLSALTALSVEAIENR